MDDAIRELGEATRRLNHSLDGLINDRQPYNSSASSINVNAGGIGVWVATTCCIAMLAVSGVAGLWINREFTAKQIADVKQDQQISDLGDHLHAIYMQAPQLQSLPKKEIPDVDHRPHPAEKATTDREFPGVR